jgi:aminoglycoside phosphotransferase (APT) family kinase protein
VALRNILHPDKAAHSLAAWWQATHPDSRDVSVTDLHIPHSSGMSSETILFRVSWAQGTVRRADDLVARLIHPGGRVLPWQSFELERAAMDAVRTSTDLPAPAVHLIEHDAAVLGAPFLLMNRLPGIVLPDDPPFTAAGWLLELPADRQATLFDNGLAAIVGVHRADTSGFGPDTLGHPDRPGTLIGQHLRHWERFYRATAGAYAHPTIDAALGWATAYAPTDTEAPVLCWGDARLGNLMFGPDQTVTAVLDWELASLGPPELDLAWFVYLNRVYSAGFGLPSPPGFPTRQQTLRRYEELAGRTVRDFDFHYVFAGLRLAVIFLRLGTMMIDAGLLEPGAAFPISNPPSQELARVLDLPPPSTTDGGWFTGHR